MRSCLLKGVCLCFSQHASLSGTSAFILVCGAFKIIEGKRVENPLLMELGQARMGRGLLLVTCLQICLQASAGELLMVYSIQRHGARNVLSKTSLLKESDLIGGPTLLPEGQQQTYAAGREVCCEGWQCS